MALIKEEDLTILIAALSNILSWFVSTFCPSLLPYLLPTSPEEDTELDAGDYTSQTKCIAFQLEDLGVWNNYDW